MSRLKSTLPNAAVRDILPNILASVVNIQWIWSVALKLAHKESVDQIPSELRYQHNDTRLELLEHSRPWSFDGHGHLLHLVLKLQRIPPEHIFYPVFAVQTAFIEVLSHQITRVYEPMPLGQPLDTSVVRSNCIKCEIDMPNKKAVFMAYDGDRHIESNLREGIRFRCAIL